MPIISISLHIRARPRHHRQKLRAKIAPGECPRESSIGSIEFGGRPDGIGRPFPPSLPPNPQN
jgi:hypothetical protein